MVKKIFTLFFILILVSIYYLGCVSGSSCNYKSGCRIDTDYIFKMSDSLNNKLIDGTLNINDCKDEKISGIYGFTSVYNDSFPGFSSMKGKFKGTVNKKENKVYINTNPSLSDYNILLSLSVKNDTLSGTWSLSTLRGIKNSGYFIATKNMK